MSETIRKDIDPTWKARINDFKFFLRLEKSLSENSVKAYLADIHNLASNCLGQTPESLELEDFERFITLASEFGLTEKSDEGLSARSQARLISGIRAFYSFLVLENHIDNNPAEMLEIPKISSKLPEFLVAEEVDQLIAKIDLSSNEGHRNKAIIETLYSCGLRVSELVNLKISDLFFEQRFIKVTGKGLKQRLVPIGEKAISEINYYTEFYRSRMKIHDEFRDILFLNRRGKQLTRVMIFTIVKRLAIAAEFTKKVSPHTFRHSFATALVKGGADLRAVQEMLGHESIITTEIYTHLDREYLRQVIHDFHPRGHL